MYVDYYFHVAASKNYCGFLGWRFVPHSRQNFEFTGMRVWHLGQMSTTGLGAGV